MACALLAIFLVAPSAEKTSPPSARSYVAVTDTLHVDAAAGKPVLVLLPDRAAYALERAPATSWLVDRTFLWTTGEGDAGRYEILLARDRAGLVDTLVLFVTIE